MSKPKGESRPRTRVRIKQDDEEIGYGKPPRANQFKPGQSGNPRGRPKGAKNEGTILKELLQHKVGIHERGRTRKIILLEAILRRVAEDCLKGNIKSVGFLLSRYHAAASADPVQTDISQEDQAMLEAYLRQFKPTLEDDKDQS